jgi:hypothetical protein
MRQLSEKRLVEARVNHLTEHVAWCAKEDLPVSVARSSASLAVAKERLAALKAAG